jgi:GT2 family glycosyltransferase
MVKLSVNLVSWNGAKYVPYLFDSLRKQTLKDWQLLIVDNNSQDVMLELMKKELINFPVKFEIIGNKSNLGFAGGHNMAFKKIDSEYVLMLNQDMYLMPDCLEKIVKFLDYNTQVVAASPRLMKWNFNEVRQGLEKSFTDQIDTLGLEVFRNRRVVEKFAGQSWLDVQKNIGNTRSLRVFGLSGALPFFRKSKVEEVVFQNGNIFDELYQSYKEDVDLAFRLAAHDSEACIALDAVAYHDRSASGSKDTSDTAAMANKKTQSEWVKYHSYKNHLMTLFKNEYWQNLILDLPWILWYELKKFVYYLIFDRKVLAGLKEIWRLKKDLKDKRKFIENIRKINWKQIRKLYGFHRI